MLLRILVLAASVLADCLVPCQLVAAAEGGVPRIVIILPDSPSFDQALLDQLTAKGLVEGKSIKIDWRSYKGWDAAMDSMIMDLVRSSPDVIVVHGTPATRAVLRQTKTIPVVFDVGDPLATGLLSSLSHPDRNATGVSTTSVEGSAKLFDLITQLVPHTRRIFVVRNSLNPLAVKMIEHIKIVAAATQVRLSVVDAKNADELVSALTRIKKRHGEAILIPTDLVFRTEKARITRAVLKTGLPAVYQDLSIAEAGGLISYGPDGAEIGQIMADLVERILRGAKPAELPVEQVTKLKLVVNLKTAKEMGIVIPQSIMTRADELIR